MPGSMEAGRVGTRFVWYHLLGSVALLGDASGQGSCPSSEPNCAQRTSPALMQVQLSAFKQWPWDKDEPVDASSQEEKSPSPQPSSVRFKRLEQTLGTDDANFVDDRTDALVNTTKDQRINARHMNEKLGDFWGNYVLDGNNPLDNKTHASNETSEHDSTNTSLVVTTKCVTRKDERVQSSLFFSSSPGGTPCVFGVDPRDEGSHCIHGEGEYGTYGWCYTDKGGGTWGSCSPTCPFYGPTKVLAVKVVDIRTQVANLSREVKRKVVPEEAASAIVNVTEVVDSLGNATNGTINGTQLLLVLTSASTMHVLKDADADFNSTEEENGEESPPGNTTTSAANTTSNDTISNANESSVPEDKPQNATDASCMTAKDDMAASYNIVVDAKCIFGADPRDEGYHCIMEDGKFGSFGWCYTDTSGSWGSCSEACPLFGPEQVLAAKIDKLSESIERLFVYVKGLPDLPGVDTAEPEAGNKSSATHATDEAQAFNTAEDKSETAEDKSKAAEDKSKTAASTGTK